MDILINSSQMNRWLRFAYRLGLLFFVAFLSLNSFAQDPISDVEKLALSRWGDRHNSRHSRESGTLLNPPLGRPAVSVKIYEQLVREILEKKYPGIFLNNQVIVGIYSSPTPDAYVEKVNPKSHRLVLQKYYGFDTRKPIYHFGFSLGLVQMLETVDELAFVVRHERVHFSEKHLELLEDGTTKEKGGSWWSLQRFESIADHLAIQSMVGEYELTAARDVLWKLASYEIKNQGPASQKDPDRFSDTAEAMLASHHDRGVRIAMAQSYIEHLRSTNPEAHIRPRKPLPPEILKTRNSRSAFRETRFSVPDLELLKRAYLVVVQEQAVELTDYLNGGLLYAVTAKNGLRAKLSPSLFKHLARLAMQTPDRASYLDLMESLIGEIVSDPVVVREHKIRQLWILYRLMTSSFPRTNSIDKLEPLFKFSHAIVSVLGREPFEWDPFIAHFEIHDKPEFYADPILALLTVNASGRALFEKVLQAKVFGSEVIGQRKLDYGQLDNILLDEPFSDVTEKPRKTNTIFGNYVEYRNIQRKLILDFLNQNLGYFTSKDFFSNLRSSEKFQSEAHAFLETLETVQKRSEDVVIKSPFFQAALAVKPYVLRQIQFNRDTFYIELARVSGPLSSEQLGKLKRDLNLAQRIPLKANEAAVVQKLFTAAAQYILNTPDRVVLRSYTPMTEQLLEANLIPVGSTIENFNSLLMIGNEGVPSDPKDAEKVEASVLKLLQLIPVELMKRSLFQNRFAIFQQRYLEVINSVEFQQDLEKLKILNEQVNAAMKDNNIIKLMDILDEFARHEHKVNSQREYIYDGMRIQFGIFALFDVPKVKAALVNEFKLKDIDGFFKLFFSLRKNFANLHRMIDTENQEKSVDSRNMEVEEALKKTTWSARYAREVSFFLDVFVLRQHEITDLAVWTKYLRNLLEISSLAGQNRPDLYEKLNSHFLKLSNNCQDPKTYSVIRDKNIRGLLSEVNLAKVLMIEVERRSGKDISPDRLRKIFESIESEQSLNKDAPDVAQLLRQQIAEKYRLQPDTFEQVFPKNAQEINTANTKGYSTVIRGLSTLASFVRKRTVTEQIETIDFLMGRVQEVPQYILEYQKKTSQDAMPLLYSLRSRLARALEIERAFVLASILTGPDGLLEQPRGQETILKKLFTGHQNQSIANELAEALLTSLGREKSLALGYVLAQKYSPGSTQLSEGQILKALFEAFGVAGIKLGQYLAFTSDLASVRNALKSLQDSAMPISYLDLLSLVSQRLGKDFSQHWQIVEILGTGSVNVAFEVRAKNSETGEVRVISILREDIENRTRESFRKLHAFVQELIKKNPARYGFILGLLNVIEKSTMLEFNKQNAFDRQKDAEVLHDRVKGGWTLKTPRALELLPGAVAMGKADGVTATTLRTQDFEKYKEAMRIVVESEFDQLLNSKIFFLRNFPAIANPDLHDGQVIVDVVKKIIWMLDFGQAVRISKNERDIGLFLLRILVSSEKFENFYELIQKLSVQLDAKEKFTVAELKSLHSRTDRMDRYSYFLGLAGSHNWDIPLSVINFIQAVDRVSKLAEAVGYDLTKKFELILKVRAVTRSTEVGYWASKTVPIESMTCLSLFK